MKEKIIIILSSLCPEKFAVFLLVCVLICLLWGLHLVVFRAYYWFCAQRSLLIILRRLYAVPGIELGPFTSKTSFLASILSFQSLYILPFLSLCCCLCACGYFYCVFNFKIHLLYFYWAIFGKYLYFGFKKIKND